MRTGTRAPLLVRAGVALSAALVVAGGMSACSSDAGPAGVCGAYLRFNDAIAEAHDVTDLRRAANTLAGAVPGSATGQVAASQKALHAAVANPDATAQSFFDAAAGIAASCQFDQGSSDLDGP